MTLQIHFGTIITIDIKNSKIMLDIYIHHTFNYYLAIKDPLNY